LLPLPEYLPDLDNSVYVGYPHIAQDGISDAKLVVQSQKALSPTPDSIELEIDNVFITGSKYHPELSAFNASLHLEGRDEAFVSFEVPAIKAQNGTVAHIRQRVNLTNMDEFTRYTMQALSSEEYTVVLKGKGGLKLGGLPKTDVKYNKPVTLKGRYRSLWCC
jgi:hypothetical protein